MEQNHKKILSRNLPYLRNTLDPQQLLPHLPCLSQSSKEQIECQQNNRGKQAGVSKLHEFLISSPKAWDQLMAALRDPDLELEYVAERLDPSPNTADTKEDRPPGPAKQSQASNIGSLKPGANSCHVTTVAGKQGTGKCAIGRDTPWNDLNAGVREVLKQLDINEGADKLADVLGLTIRDYLYIRAHKSDDGVALGVIEDWNCREVTTLGQLMSLLKRIERLDVLHDLEKATGYKLPENDETENKINPGNVPINSSQIISKDAENNSSSNVIYSSKGSSLEVDSVINSLQKKQDHCSNLVPASVDQHLSYKISEVPKLPDAGTQLVGSDPANSVKTSLVPSPRSVGINHMLETSVAGTQLAGSDPDPANFVPASLVPSTQLVGTKPVLETNDTQLAGPVRPGVDLIDRSLSIVDDTAVLQPYTQDVFITTPDEREPMGAMGRDTSVTNQWHQDAGEVDFHRVSYIRQESQPPGIPISPVSVPESTLDNSISSTMIGVSECSQSDDDSYPWWEGKVASDRYTRDVTIRNLEEDSSNNNGNTYEGTLDYPSASNCRSIRPFHQPVSIDDDVIDVNKTVTSVDIHTTEEILKSDMQELSLENVSLETSQSDSSNASIDTVSGEVEESELSSILKKGLKPFPDFGPNYHEEDDDDIQGLSTGSDIQGLYTGGDIQGLYTGGNIQELHGGDIQELYIDDLSRDIVETVEAESLGLDPPDMTSRGVGGELDQSNVNTDEQVYDTVANEVGNDNVNDQIGETNDINTVHTEGLSNDTHGELGNEPNVDNDETSSSEQNMNSGLFSWSDVLGGAVVGAVVYMSLKK